MGINFKSLLCFVFWINFTSNLQAQVLPSSFGAYNPSRTVANSTIVSSGLVLHLDAGNASSYPGSGTTWNDLSGNGRNMTLFNGTAYNSNGYFDFDGIDDYAQTSNNGLGKGSRIPHTLEMWVNFDLLTSPRWWLAVIGQYGQGAHHLIGTTGASFGTWNARCNTVPTLTGTNNWMHLVGTFDGTTLTYYVNSINTSCSCTADQLNFTNTQFTIGLRGNSNSESFFNGKVSIVRIYNRALTVSEIHQNFNATRGRFAIGEVTSTTVANSTIGSSGLVLHLDAGNASSYPGSGTTWTDLSGNGYNGTLTNGPTYSSANGGSIGFDGSNDVASFGNILNMGLNSWTLSCWVKFNSGSGPQGIIGKTSYRAYAGRYAFFIEDGNLNAHFTPTLSPQKIPTPIAPYLDNKFHNLVMTIDRSSMMYFYIDGVSVGRPLNVSCTSNINLNSTDNFYIGSYGDGNGVNPAYFLNGNVSQASIYNRALTAAEVLQNYNDLRTRFAIGEVTSVTTGRIWMDRNLGATQVATSSTDAASYGDLYQWGRGTDGHQIRTSGTTTTISSTDQPGNGNFILAPNSPYDWRSPQNDNLWQGVSGVNNPCPTGYRIPTEAEWDAERLSWSTNNALGAFASPLKLPKAGYRDNSNGSLFDVGASGRYWSSAVSGADARHLYFSSSTAYMGTYGRAVGSSVRCIKD